MSRLRWPIPSHSPRGLTRGTQIYFAAPWNRDEYIDNAAESTQTILSAEAESPVNSAESTQSLGETIVGASVVGPLVIAPIPSYLPPEPVRTTTIYFALPETVTIFSETVTNEATSSQTIASAIAESAAQPEGVQDNFNRVDLDSNWAKLNSNHATFSITSNQLQAGGTLASIYFLPITNLSDGEVGITISTVGGATHATDVAARIQQPGGSDTWDGYIFRWTPSPSLFELYKVVNSIDNTSLAMSTTSGTLSNGDKIKIRLVGSVIEGWVFRSGAWEKVLTATDTSYSTGSVGLIQVNNTARLDDFVVTSLNANVNSHRISDAIAETTTQWNNEAFAYGGGGYGGGEYGSDYHTLIEVIVGASVTDTLTNTGAGTQTILSAEAQAANQGGTGSHTTADATAETDTNTGTGTHVLVQALAEAVVNSQASTQTLVEVIAVSDTITNSASSTQTVLSAEAQAANNAGTASHTTADATAEAKVNTGTGSQTVLEALADAPVNSANSTQTIAQAVADTEGSSGTGTQVVSDATAEAQVNVGSGSSTQLEAEAQFALNSAESTQTLVEDFVGVVIETLDNVGVASFVTLEAEAELNSQVGTASHSILSAEADSTTNTGSGTGNISDATAEMIANMAVALFSLDENITVVVAEIIDAPGYHMEYEFVPA